MVNVVQAQQYRAMEVWQVARWVVQDDKSPWGRWWTELLATPDVRRALGPRSSSVSESHDIGCSSFPRTFCGLRMDLVLQNIIP